MLKLKRIQTGVYETLDGVYRIEHWDTTAGNRKSWAISSSDGEVREFLCEVWTLRDARKYLQGEQVFILS